MWPHRGVLTVRVKVPVFNRGGRSSVQHFFLQITAKNGSSEMSRCVSPAKARTQRAPRIGVGIFPEQIHSKWLSRDWAPAFFLSISTQNAFCEIGVRHFTSKFPHKLARVTSPCAFRLRRLAQSLLPGLGIGFPPLCSHMCALISVLSHVCSHICAFICVLSYVCSPICSHLCDLLCALLCAFS